MDYICFNRFTALNYQSMVRKRKRISYNYFDFCCLWANTSRVSAG